MPKRDKGEDLKGELKVGVALLNTRLGVDWGRSQRRIEGT